MAINLVNVANGKPANNSCNNNLVPTQKVVIVPEDPIASCQTQGPIEPSKRTVGITVRNMIVGACGVFELEFDNGATGATDKKLPFGGPAKIGNATVVADMYNWDAMTSATFTSKVKGQAPDATISGTTNGYAVWNQIINDFFASGESIIVSQISIRRVANGSAIIDEPATPFYVGQSQKYAVDYASEFYAKNTSVSDSTQDVVWDFSTCDGGGIPLSQTTGFDILIPGGYGATFIICVAAVETNIDYAEGCA